MNDKLTKYWDNIHINHSSSYDNWLDNYMHIFKSNSTIIELGCGRAYSSNYLFNLGYKDITACDFSKQAIDFVNK